jgi:spore coat protein SA
MMMKKKRICIVTGAQLPIPDVKGGAVERLVTMLIEDNEIKKDFLFTVVSAYDSLATEEQKKYNYTEFVNLRQPNKIMNSIQWQKKKIAEWFTNKYQIRLLGIYQKIERYLLKNRDNFDLIINECADSLSLSKVAEVIGKDKICRHFHAVEMYNEGFDDVYGSTISISNFVREAFMQHSEIPAKDNYVLLNCIDQRRFLRKASTNEKENLCDGLGINAEDFVVLYCGRIVKEKGVKELIEAVTSINDDNLKLLVVGASDFALGNYGKYVNDVNNLISKNSSKIVFTGFVNNRDLYKYYQIASIVAIPSLCEEGFGLVMAESMISGLPQIATISGGMSEVGTENTTFFVNKDDRIVQELRNAIIFLKSNHGHLEFMKKACEERGLAFYRDSYYSNFKSIINNILNN